MLGYLSVLQDETRKGVKIYQLLKLKKSQILMISFKIPATSTEILCILIVYSLQILRLISAAGSVFCSWRVSYHTACQAEAPQKEPK